MGRRKITIKPIAHASTRRATFEKRRIGLLKKAIELSILCRSTVSVTIYTGDGDVYIYSSEPYENVIQKFENYRGSYRLLTNDHLEHLVPGKSSSNSIGYEIIKQSSSSANQIITNPNVNYKHNTPQSSSSLLTSSNSTTVTPPEFRTRNSKNIVMNGMNNNQFVQQPHIVHQQYTQFMNAMNAMQSQNQNQMSCQIPPPVQTRNSLSSNTSASSSLSSGMYNSMINMNMMMNNNCHQFANGMIPNNTFVNNVQPKEMNKNHQHHHQQQQMNTSVNVPPKNLYLPKIEDDTIYTNKVQEQLNTGQTANVNISSTSSDDVLPPIMSVNDNINSLMNFDDQQCLNISNGSSIEYRLVGHRRTFSEMMGIDIGLGTSSTDLGLGMQIASNSWVDGDPYSNNDGKRAKIVEVEKKQKEKQVNEEELILEIPDIT